MKNFLLVGFKIINEQLLFWSQFYFEKKDKIKNNHLLKNLFKPPLTTLIINTAFLYAVSLLFNFLGLTMPILTNVAKIADYVSFYNISIFILFMFGFLNFSSIKE